MEKSSLNAATTRTIAANSTAANVAMPARRAVSPRRAEAASLPNNAKKPARKEYALRPSASSSAKLPIRDIRETPLFLYRIFSEKRVVCKPPLVERRGGLRAALLLLQRVTLFAPIADSAVHGNDIRVSHFLQVIGGQRGTEAAATIEHEFSFEIRILALNVALDDALAQVDGSGQVVGIEYAVFANVDQNEFLAAIEPGFDRVNAGFPDALLGGVDNLQKARWMLMCHVRRSSRRPWMLPWE